MGKLKEALSNAEHAEWYLKTRNAKRHGMWAEDMPDLTGQALADAESEFLSERSEDIDEADNMPLWIQLELDLWEGQHGIGTFTAWDLAGGDDRG